MKKIFFICFTIFWSAFSITGCNKGKDTTLSPPKVTPAPEWISLKVIPDTAWFKGSATLDFAASNTTSFTIGKDVTTGSSYVVSDLVSDTTYKVTATGPGGSSEKSIKVPVHTERMTLFCNTGTVHMISSKSRNLDTLSDPRWYDGPPDPNVYQFFSNGSGQINSGQIFSGVWYFQNNQTELALPIGNGGLIDLWKLDSISSSGWQRSQIKNGFITIQKFAH